MGAEVGPGLPGVLGDEAGATAAYEAALEENGKNYTAHFYPGTNHGFHNDTTSRYDEAAATLAWSRTLDFFAKHLA